MHATPSASPPPCKICGSVTLFFDRCDFHANAKVHKGYYDVRIEPSGILLDFFACTCCGFIFTPFMDQWVPGDFATYVYNKEYPRLDGSYNGARAGGAANIFYLAFHDYLSQLEFLDYGGGIGFQSALLQAFGAKRALTYDPFASGSTRPEGKFNMVSCLEVLEHSTDPKKTVADLVSFVDKESGLVFVGTECSPPDIARQKCSWWYITPRVGHVSFYTPWAIDAMFAEHGMKVLHLEHHTHIAYQSWPLWANQMFPPENLPT
jgi:2-polyprenyl-6-hydroxyphenyl methylase/3-demethylubiquinone-9 3-methyltransferase